MALACLVLLAIHHPTARAEVHTLVLGERCIDWQVSSLHAARLKGMLQLLQGIGLCLPDMRQASKVILQRSAAVHRAPCICSLEEAS